MIIFRMEGGLGNQLFQYAAARVAGRLLDTEVLLDRHLYTRDPRRQFALDRFDITLQVTDRWRRTKGITTPLDWLRYRALRLRLIDRRVPIDEPFETLLRNNHFYRGYWQRHDIPALLHDTLRNELQLFDEPPPANADRLAEARESESVSIHVRRTDYLRYSQFGTCSPAYYFRAIEYLTSRIGSESVFVFSDDIAWTRANICLPGHPQFVPAQSISARKPRWRRRRRRVCRRWSGRERCDNPHRRNEAHPQILGPGPRTPKRTAPALRRRSTGRA